MTKDKAFQKYLEDFMRLAFPDAPINEDEYFYAYPETNVPEEAILPYMTYDNPDGDFGDGDITATIKLWMHTESEAVPNEKARLFKKYITFNPYIECDEGVMWVKTGTPFSVSIRGEGMQGLKAKLINLEIEHITEVK